MLRVWALRVTGSLVLLVSIGLLASSAASTLGAATHRTPPGLSPATAVRSDSSSTELFSDDFSHDSSLSSALWTVNGPEATASGSVYGDHPLDAVRPSLSFSSENGLTMTGVSADYTFADVQGDSAFFPPIVVQARVMATVSNGNPFLLALGTANGGQGIVIEGNLNSSNPYYGLGSSVAQGNGSVWLGIYTFTNAPQLNTWYSLTLAVNASGLATASVNQGTTEIGSVSYYIGLGAYYLFLMQVVDAPPAVGPNSASWSYVYVNQTAAAPPTSPAPFFTPASTIAIGLGALGAVLAIIALVLTTRRERPPPTAT
jgi:hypothetical protein